MDSQGSGLSPFAGLSLSTTPTMSLPPWKLSWSVDSTASTPRRDNTNRNESPFRLKLSARGNLIRRMNSAPSPTTLSLADSTDKENSYQYPRSPGKLRLPLEDQDTNSQDSGCSDDTSSSDVRFVIPSGFPPRKNVDPSPSKVWLDDDGASSPQGARRFLVPLGSPMSRSIPSSSSPTNFKSNPLRSHSFCSTDSFDDGFSELADLEKPDEHAPSALASLLTEPLLGGKGTEKRADTSRPTMRKAFSMVENQINNVSSPGDGKLTYKRPRELCAGGGLLKRRKASGQVDAPRHKLQRSASENAATLLSSTLSNLYGRPDLIADFSRPYSLPVVPGKHTDLTSIMPATLAAVINGEFSCTVRSYTIIDCRYPYEFEGGHIRGAINLYTCDQVEAALLSGVPIAPTGGSGAETGSDILIFHCEFSLARGPSMYRWLRRLDRNNSNYPCLQYPEIYLLHGGYKRFYEAYETLCEPVGYRPMQAPGFEADLRKNSTWSVSRASLKRLHLL